MEERKVSASPLGVPPIASHHERLIGEVEGSDGQLGAILRTLYEEEEQESFHESLTMRIKAHEKDIERMCNKNYQGFIESVGELLKVKSDAMKLKRKVQEVNLTIQDTGQQLMQSAAELHQARHVQKNILSTMEALGLCIPVLQQYCKLKEQMEAREFYSALKTLEQLEHTYLPQVKGYTFSDLLNKEIPKLRNSIQDQSSDELTDFLANVREKSIFIGEVAMHQAARQWNLELPRDIDSLLDESQAPDPDVCAQDLIDFSPVYRCLHIHTVLGKREQFIENYRSGRRSQVRLAIKPRSVWKGEINDFKCYFYGIMGFFVVEDTILHTTQELGPHKGEGEGLVTRKIVHEFWQMALSEVLAVLRNNCNSCRNYHLLLKVKQLVVWLCHALRGYGFAVDKLYEVLLEIREQYDEVLMKAWGDSFTQIFTNDNYTPVVAETEEQYQGVLELFPYNDVELVASPFPKCFPFSGMVGQVYCQLEAFVRNCNDYADRLNLSQMEVCDIVSKSVNLLLSRTMSSSLSRLVHGEGLTIPQLGQVWVNIDHLANSIHQLEKFIVNTVTKTESEGVSTVRLYGGSTFKDAKVAAEQQIIVRLTAKCAEIMECAAYDWTTKEVRERPSDYLNDCLHYLETTFTALQILPEELVSNVCHQALKNLSLQMESVLLADNPKVSMDGIRSFNVDLTCCQKFVMSTVTRYSYLKDTDAVLAFEPLRQLVDVFLNEKWSDYVSEYPNLSERHKNVSPRSVYGLLTRLRQAEKKKNKLPIHVKNPAKKKDPKKLALITLEDKMATEGLAFSSSPLTLHGKKAKASPTSLT